MTITNKRIALAQTALTAALLGCLPLASAEPWIEAGDQRSRHHLQVLADGDHINLPLTSWPLMWGSVNQQLADIETANLTASEMRSYRYLRHELQRAQQPTSRGSQLSASSSHLGLTDFATESRERWESRTYGAYTGERWAFKLQFSVVGDAIDDQQYRLDGSYLAAVVGNWVVGAGAVDRWWGPGWQSSLILSDSARPSPGLFLQRAASIPFDLPVLEWLGPWSVHAFFNQLESDRPTARAHLLGMRVSFQPFESLELGLSRTAQWGGEGRPEDWESFRRMVVGQSNRGGDGLAPDGSDEPANQLAGYDWRLSHAVNGVSGAFYGQLIGEDEAGGLPYKFLGVAGVEGSFVSGTTQNRLALEVSNTTMEFDKGGTPNVAYEHPRYPSGYRYRGRPIGASSDNDSELVVLKGFHYFANAHQFRWTVGSGNINIDDTNLSSPGGNVLTDRAVDLHYATMHYALPVKKNGELAVGLQYYSDALSIGDGVVDTGVRISYSVRIGSGRQ